MVITLYNYYIIMYFFIVILLISLFIELDDKMALCKSHHNSTNIDCFTLIFFAFKT